jgi:hypothetical protein
MGSSNNADGFDPTSDTINNALLDIFVRCERAIFLFEPLTVAAK